MRWTLLAGTIGLLAMASVPGSSAQADATLVIEAYDDGEECPGDRSYCYEVEEGDLSDLAAGDRVEITLVNEGQLEHELAMAPLAEADPDRENTSEEGVVEEIEPIGSGEEATKTFEIPDADGIYLWCDLQGHEGLGMWTAQSFTAEGAEDGQTGAENGAPGPGLPALLAIVSFAALRERV